MSTSLSLYPAEGRVHRCSLTEESNPFYTVGGGVRCRQFRWGGRLLQNAKATSKNGASEGKGKISFTGGTRGVDASYERRGFVERELPSSVKGGSISTSTG